MRRGWRRLVYGTPTSAKDVYKTKYDKQFPVVCMDESPKQLIKETRLAIAQKRGSERKEDYEYERCGVANIFMANEPLTGKRYVKVTEVKTKLMTGLKMCWINWLPAALINWMNCCRKTG